MGISKTEVNLRRLLAAAPKQQNQTKCIHYITTLRELLEQLGTEISSEGISRVPKAKLNEYSEETEALASKLASKPSVPVEDAKEIEETNVEAIKVERISSTVGKVSNSNGTLSSGFRRRTTLNQVGHENGCESKERGTGAPIRLDAEAQNRIEKHRNLQDDLTDEILGLATQLKESSFVMNQSLQETGKILDSTERAVGHSLAGTSRANVRAMEGMRGMERQGLLALMAVMGQVISVIMSPCERDIKLSCKRPLLENVRIFLVITVEVSAGRRLADHYGSVASL